MTKVLLLLPLTPYPETPTLTLSGTNFPSDLTPSHEALVLVSPPPSSPKPKHFCDFPIFLPAAQEYNEDP